MRPDQFNRIVQYVINTRDLCGNEREAMIDAAADEGLKLTAEDRGRIMGQVNKVWADWQCAARVTNPISSDERAQINRALED